MSTPSSTTHIVDTLQQYEDAVSWINDTLILPDDDELTFTVDLTELEQQINQLLTALDIGSEDTSTHLERLIDDVSRGIPRLAYDLHFMKDGASTLQNALVAVLQRSRDAVPKETSIALDNLHQLDTIKGRMEAAREVLREAESWSTLEHEVTALIAEKSYAKAAERLSDANKSMVVWQNTIEYDPRRTLMVNLQNQLEAALSTALLSAINAQDSAACKNYFAIFSDIQRESEFRNYYYASRRSPVVSLWHTASLSDCDGQEPDGVLFTDFLPRFYSNFATLLNNERSSISSIFPNPVITTSQFISSTMSSLQPAMSQRLVAFSMYYGDAALPQLIVALRATEEFATGVEKVMEKIQFASPMLPSMTSGSSAERTSTHRRRQSRMSISLRPGQHRSTSNPIGTFGTANSTTEPMEWDQEMFQPFLDFQVDYGSLERRFLEQSLFKIIASDTREKVQATDRPRLFRERAVDIFGAAEDSMNRCKLFTHGYGAAGLLQTLDGFFQSFFDMWTADVQSESHGPPSVFNNTISDGELADLDYTAQDWSDIQLSLHLLASARSVSDRLSVFETKLRNYLSQVASHFKFAVNDPNNLLTGATRGESQLLEQSTLNSAELHSLLRFVENDPSIKDPPFSSSVRLQAPPSPPEPLLKSARKALSNFALTCQNALIKTILTPLRNHLSSYPSLPAWRLSVDPNSSTSRNDLKVPTFSLSPTEAVQRVAEGLLNLPRLFEVYADDDALAFGLETLPFLESDTLKSLTEQVQETPNQTSHRRRPSTFMKPVAIDAEAVSSAWLISLGHSFLQYLTSDILPAIPSLTTSGAAQLASDLEYLSNIVRALNVEHAALDKWKTYVSLPDEDGVKAFREGDAQTIDPVLDRVSRLRGWR
ncbi:oligomeric Golgi complex subunit 7 [Crepidotus variabilis]|uniref:Conserved oligomeric Golgi complex subunit 7 n=1 Tax=Crepidotus variabilis TaxID=179855 RepID=A0A9P6JQG4_9AGAR|nr:oligomeric Golgi complex subunit 7 [Crepidotus variabilis]